MLKKLLHVQAIVQQKKNHAESKAKKHNATEIKIIQLPPPSSKK